MKRKLLIALLSLTVAACGFGLVACDKEGEKNSNVEITNINQAYSVATELGYGGTLDEFIIAIKGEKGDKGEDGKDGKDGVGVENIIIDADGVLVITLTNGAECHLDKIGSADGRGIIKAEFNENGEVVFTYSDGTSENIGKIPDCVHSYGEWTAVEEATCTSIGYSTRVCAACGYKDYGFTRAKGHYFDWGITLKEATCTEDGYKQYSCCDCHAVKAETVPAIGHSFENGTCANCGRETYSEGLEFSLSADGTYYILEGMGTCTDVDLIIPETYNNLPVAAIGKLAYNKRLNIKSVTIPRSITSIGRFAFSDCTRLEKVYFNAENCADLASWGSDAFIGSGGEHGISVVIGKYVQRIPAHLFHWSASSVSRLVNVVSLTFEADSVLKTIGESAFAVSGLIEVNLPDSVEVIGKDAFRQSERLKTVNLGNGVTAVEAGAFDSCGNIENISIPDSITRFEFSYFVNNKKLKLNEYKNCLYLGNEQNPYTVLVDVATEEETSYEIHGDAKLVYNSAFAWCRRLKSITIPEGVVTVDSAFGYCPGLTEINLPSTVTSFRGGFRSCNINKFTVAENNPVYYVRDNCVIDRTTKTLTAGCNTSIIPDDGSVTAIGDSAFFNCNFESVVIPECIASIGVGAFGECVEMVSIELHENITYIGKFAFRGCDKLISISIPDGITEIGDQTFMRCESLETVEIPDSVTSIGSGAFQSCDKLKNIVLPDGVQIIGDFAFAYCPSLESITIPETVTEIENYAFYECENLKTVYFSGTRGEWEVLLYNSGTNNPVLKTVTVHFGEE